MVDASKKLLAILDALKHEYELGARTSGNADIPSTDLLKAGGIKSLQLHRLMREFETLGLLKQVIFIDGDEAQYEEEYDYDVWRVMFPSDFISRYNTYTQSLPNKKEIGKRLTSSTKLYAPNAIAEMEVKGLAVFSDGTIRYKDELVEMRTQLKELCRLFIANPNRLITVDDIKEKMIAAPKREHTPFSTIAKYVSELRRLLQVHFGKDVLPNQKEEGWWFRP